MGNGPSSRALSRIEVAILLGFSVIGHTALAVKLTRPNPPEVRPQTVAIEVEPPPVEPPKVPSPLPPPSKAAPRPVAHKIALRTHFAPPPPVDHPPVSDAPPEAPPAPEPAPAPAESDPPGPPPPPAAPPPIARPAPVVAAHEGANYLKNPRPPYPEMAMRHDWQGEVLLRVRVSPTGRVEGVQVERSSGHDVLDEAAVEAVRAWTFVPSRQGGVAISGWVSVPIVFRLQQGE